MQVSEESKMIDDPDKNRKERIQKMFDRYLVLKTLQKVADEYGVSRERVRQYLSAGNEMGIIDYKPFNRENFKRLKNKLTKEVLIQQFEQYGTIRKIMDKTEISLSHLTRLLKTYEIDTSYYRRKYLKKGIVKEYEKMVEKLEGRHPSTYDLLLVDRGRNLWAKISRNWGTFEQFRKEQGIQFSRKQRKKKTA